MLGSELEAFRRLLFYSRQEAGLWVAASPERPNGVSERAWKQWESSASVPEDVEATIIELLAWRRQFIANAGDLRAIAIWTDSLESWARLHKMPDRFWRPHQSAVAAIHAARYGG
jgi:hypothetical protein